MNHIASAPRLAPGAFLLSLLILLLLSLGACQRGEAEQGGLVGASIGGPFELTDQDGKRVKDSDFNGRYRLMYFGFANCPDVCPVDMVLAGEALRRFEEQDPEQAERVQPIFVTVDPERDTPEVLKAYVANFHPRLIGLTGTREEIDRALTAFGTYGMKGDAAAGDGYNVNHSRYFLLFGPDGEPIAMIPHDKGVDGFVKELDRWVQ